MNAVSGKLDTDDNTLVPGLHSVERLQNSTCSVRQLRQGDVQPQQLQGLIQLGG
jgi:hypothetical protein